MDLNPLTANALLIRNQSIDLLCKSIDWFLYEKDIDRFFHGPVELLPINMDVP